VCREIIARAKLRSAADNGAILFVPTTLTYSAIRVKRNLSVSHVADCLFAHVAVAAQVPSSRTLVNTAGAMELL
jgi:hypothetical protein